MPSRRSDLSYPTLMASGLRVLSTLIGRLIGIL